MMRKERARARGTEDLGAANPRERFFTAALGLLLVGALGLSGCDALLDVENPNQLVQSDLETPASAAALANGALSTVARAAGDIALLHGSAADEVQFTGSRDAWIQLQEGDLRDPANEFSDAAWPFVTEGRWMADEAVRLLSVFDQEGTLGNRNLLARAQLYSAVMRTLIADVWEDFVLSDRQETGPPVGSENMLQFYDHAIGQLDAALAIAQATGNAAVQAQVLAQRARTKHARAVRTKFTPAGSTPADPLVNDAGAVADAQAALALVDNAWRFQFTYSSGTVSNSWGAWVNERLELRPSNAYVAPTADDKRVASITLMDPIDDVPSPALEEIIMEAVVARSWPPMTVVSARELRLILAEAALAAGNEAGFTEQINHVRTLDGLTPYSGQMDALDLLKHSRMAGLYLTGRRLADHYRFGTQSFLWNPNADAARRPGTLFPIAQVERTSNCHIVGTC
jgi:starch-binding outer membrane protein, SusD/RagB family